MRTIKGKLTEIGQTNKIGNSNQSKYLYIQVSDDLIKDVKVFDGLDGKFRGSMGRNVTVYIDGGYLIGFTDDEGKTYSSERTSPITTIFLVFLLLVGLVFSLFIVGIPIVFFVIQNMYANSKANAGADLPNAIQIPRS